MTSDRTATLTDHVLTNSSRKVSQWGVTDLGLSDHDLMFCTRKALRPKSHKHNEMLVRSVKHYAIENFKETLKKIHFPDYLKYTCINAAYSGLIAKVMRAIDSVAPIKKVRAKANFKP